MTDNPDNHAAENTIPGAGNSDLAHVVILSCSGSISGLAMPLNENVNLLLGGQDKSEEDSETTSVEDSEKPADLDTDIYPRFSQRKQCS